MIDPKAGAATGSGVSSSSRCFVLSRTLMADYSPLPARPLVSRGCVTIEMLVMPACFTASIGAQINNLLRRIDARLLQQLRQIVDVDGLVAQKHLLIAIDGQYCALLG